MAVYTIADLHLSTNDKTNKSMEVFGGRWSGYTEKLINNWKKLVSAEDTVVIPGDISWGLTTEEARADLLLVESLPGRKIIGKGNHDFWWTTMRKLDAFCEASGIKTISFLFNNAYDLGDFIIAGTRGWYYDDSSSAPDNADFDKIIAREAGRLRLSLSEAKRLSEDNPEAEIIAFTHFPPVWGGEAVEKIIDVLVEFDVKRLYFGHIHGSYRQSASFEYRGITMSLISADFLGFVPKHIPVIK